MASAGCALPTWTRLQQHLVAALQGAPAILQDPREALSSGCGKATLQHALAGHMRCSLRASPAGFADSLTITVQITSDGVYTM